MHDVSSGAQAPTPPSESEARTASWVVGVGASAGGLGAFERFFKALPEVEDVAIVLIQHLSPDHESELASLVQRHTALKVQQVTPDEPVRRGHVYVIPPGQRLTIASGHFRLQAQEGARGLTSPIDAFLSSLAEDRGEHAVAVILSGSGRDGTYGLEAVKAHGGLVMVQDPDEAEYEGMPESALGTGLVDYVLPLGALASTLAEHLRSDAPLPEDGEPHAADHAETLQHIFALVRKQTGNDFSLYKRSTVWRRLARRMQVHWVDDLQAYLEVLRETPGEADKLLHELLIGVTGFFRDPEAFEALSEVVPQLFADKDASSTVRVWVAGCATGEEAYSVAMLLHEHAATLEAPPDLQVFATDLNAEAVRSAREGVFSEQAVADLSEERRTRFFTHLTEGYQVKQSLRETMFFTQHNLLVDPPFSRIDLISCRNLLIYLTRTAQAQLLEVFHYALRPEGYLLLGSSESIDKDASSFTTVSRAGRLYQNRRLASDSSRVLQRSLVAGTSLRMRAMRYTDMASHLATVHRASLLSTYAPPSLLVNAEYELLHVQGGGGRYLHVTEGVPTKNVLSMAPAELRAELRTTLLRVFDEQVAVLSVSVRVPTPDGEERVRVRVQPVLSEDHREALALVCFEPVEEAEAETEQTSPEGEAGARVEELEGELERTRHQLRTVVEEFETTGEELRTSNEELHTMNEELQSTAEELRTVNQELKAKVEELARTNSDLQNLMAATDIATIFLDRRLRIMRYTPRATDLFNLIETDTGRPLKHVTHNLAYEGIAEEAQRVLDEQVTIEHEVRSQDDRWFILGMRPYRLAEEALSKTIAGVVITFVDISERVTAEQALKQLNATLEERVAERTRELTEANAHLQTEVVERHEAEAALRESEQRFELALRHSPMTAFTQDRDLVYTWIFNPNPYFDENDVLGKSDYDLLPEKDAEVLARVKRHAMDEEELVHELVRFTIDGQPHYYDLYVEPLRDEEGAVIGTRSASIDVTKVIHTQQALQQSEERFTRIFQAAPVGGVISSRDDGRILDVNERFVELTGYSRAELLGKTAAELDLFAHLPERLSTLEELGSEAASVDGEVKMRRRDGETQVLLASLQGMTLGEQACIVGMYQDISQRRQLERRLLEMSARLQRRVGRELHDGLGSHLTGMTLLSRRLLMNIEQGRSVGYEELDEVAELARDGVRQARMLARGLNPVDLDAYGLAVALGELSRDVEDLGGTACSYQGEDQLAEPAKEVTMHLYWIVREAVEYARKTGHASQITLDAFSEDASTRDERLTLQVVADGTYPEAPKEDSAVQLLFYRATLVGAHLALNTTPDHFELTCTLSTAEVRW